jgi:hypothetical protein
MLLVIAASAGRASPPSWTYLVPSVALVFTVASFWWLWLRRGRITVTAPKVYAGAFTRSNVFVRLPLVFHNSGARAIAVTDLRMVVDGTHELSWENIRKTVRPEKDDVLDFAWPFAVAGREARPIVVEFQQNPLRWPVEPGTRYEVRIDADMRSRGGSEPDWHEVASFDFWTPANDLTVYIGRRNVAPDTPLPREPIR